MRSFLAAAALILMPTVAQPGDIQRACLMSPRAASAPVCACIQAAANQTLTARDQRLAASFFADPGLAQEVRRSDRRRDERFWDRYRSFGQTAERFCES
ncbi:MAG: hypothetical protein AAFQ39_13905 [Pseudomonadota bacterium]